MKHAPLIIAAALLSSCGIAPPQRIMPCAAAPQPAIVTEGGEATTRFSVLTYNIEGLGWPARKGRATQLRAIGERPETQQVFAG